MPTTISVELEDTYAGPTVFVAHGTWFDDSWLFTTHEAACKYAEAYVKAAVSAGIAEPADRAWRPLPSSGVWFYGDNELSKGVWVTQEVLNPNPTHIRIHPNE